MNRGLPFQVREFTFFLFFKQYTPTPIFVLCMHNKRGLSVQVKPYYAFILGSPVYIVVNTTLEVKGVIIPILNK
jgi:hypothetical protein